MSNLREGSYLYDALYSNEYGRDSWQIFLDGCNVAASVLSFFLVLFSVTLAIFFPYQRAVDDYFAPDEVKVSVISRAEQSGTKNLYRASLRSDNPRKNFRTPASINSKFKHVKSNFKSQNLNIKNF